MAKTTDIANMASALCCTRCGVALEPEPEEAKCAGCGATYPVVDGIVCMDPGASYWGNLDAARLEEVLQAAEQSGDWRSAVGERLPRLVDHMSGRYRADSRFLCPLDRDARVLDLGAMWGGLTFPVAQDVAEVVALDKTLPTLRLLALRARQDGVGNIRAVQGGATALPFEDGIFDHVIINGVLEWVAFDTDLVLERHWSGRYPETAGPSPDPREVQLRVLREVRRVLRAGGSVSVAIENRFALPYFCGAPDDHVNVRFVPVLPRRLADLVTRARGKGPYRTYLYSERQLERLLSEAGLVEARKLGSTPHYIRAERVFPLDHAAAFRRELALGGDAAVGTAAAAMFELARPFVPRGLVRKVVPSFLFVGGAGRKPERPQLVVALLREAGVLPAGGEEPSVTLIANRHADNLPVGFAIGPTGDRDGLFCKLPRGPEPTGLASEARGLSAYAARAGEGAGDALRVPRLVFHGEANGSELLATSLVPGRAATFRDLQRATIATRVLERLPGALGGARALGHRRFREALDRGAPRCLGAVAALQSARRSGQATLLDCVRSLVTELRDAPNAGAPAIADRLEDTVADLAGRSLDTAIPRTLVHGDFDFCNLLDDGRGISAVDWEDAEEEGWPFVDLGNLLGNPPVMHHRGIDPDSPFATFCRSTGLTPVLRRWLARYCDLTGLPVALAPALLVLASAQQNARSYPSYRDPATYPLFGALAFDAMVELGRDLATP